MRKPRSLGNFSIETSYKTMRDAWPKGTAQPKVHVVNRFTSGLVDRWKIWKEVRSLKGPLIHITGDIHFAAIRMRHRPLVLTVHDLGMLNEGRRIKRWLKTQFWLNWPLKACDHLIAVSEATKRDIVQRTGYPAERIHVIPSVISPTFQARSSEPNNHKPRVLHIGLADNKNLEGHAQALVGLDVHLRIIGAPSQAQLSLLNHLKLDFSCSSKLTEAQLQEEYAASDVLLFCSTLEGYGMPIVEAQTVGVPVITSQLAPMNDTAGQGALLVNPHSPAEIQAAIQRVLSDPDLRNTLLKKGRSNASLSSASLSAKRHAELYAQIQKEKA